MLGDDAAAGVAGEPRAALGSPSMAVMRSTSIRGSSGRRTRVGQASTWAKAGPRTLAMEPMANSRQAAGDRGTEGGNGD